MTDFTARRMLGGTGNLIGPPQNALFNRVIDLALEALPLLATFTLKEPLKNENALNHHLSLFMAKVARQNDLPFIVIHQSMEDISHGNSAAPDIGIHLDIPDEAEPPPRITAFEGKQLTTNFPTKRRREYVIGHEENGKYIPCGGIERFKLSIHGRNLKYAGMIGYIQDETPDYWQGHVNSWISELSLQQETPKWSEKEHLAPVITVGRISQSASLVYRESDKLNLAHLWINHVA